MREEKGVRKCWKLGLAMLCLAFLFTGCGSVGEGAVGAGFAGKGEKENLFEKSAARINPEDVAEEQLIELLTPEKQVVCQVTGKEELIAYLEKKKFVEWEQADTIPDQAKLQCMVMSYEKVTDDFWLERGAPEISTGEEWLYEDNGNFWMKIIDSANETLYRIPASTGEYIKELMQKDVEILERKDVFAAWGVFDFDENAAYTEENAVYAEENAAYAEENAAYAEETAEGIIEKILGEKKKPENDVYTADTLKKVSKEQKVEIKFEDSDVVCRIIDLEEIADFYQHLQRSSWIREEHLPEEYTKICTITTYQLERHTAKKNLVENDQLTIFKSQQQYYLWEIIPGDFSGMEDMEIYYLISDDVVDYIRGMVQ